MPEYPPRRVAVNYRRQVSDGNYGTEAAEVSLEWHVDGADDSHFDLEVAGEMLRNAHEVVLAQLHNSESIAVRKATALRTTAPARTAATVPADDENPF